MLHSPVAIPGITLRFKNNTNPARAQGVPFAQTKGT
jgi:hypothetical protein